MFNSKRICADFDSQGIYVYQAFNQSIVKAALEKGTFGEGFSLNRMTWIKPSFTWMLQRSRYATKHNQEAILRIHIKHEGFFKILQQAVPTSYNEKIFSKKLDWNYALSHSEVRYQWDPERDLYGKKLQRRAIQLGLKGKVVQDYVNEWIIGLEDYTPLARKIYRAIRCHEKTFPQCPEEIEYPIPINLQKVMGYD